MTKQRLESCVTLSKFLTTLFFLFCAAYHASADVELEGVDLIKIPALKAVQRTRESDVKALIYHSMGTSLKKSIEILTGKAGYTVSTHYFIPAVSGREFLEKMEIEHELNYPDRIPVVELVSPENVAFHAGNSAWKGVTKERMNDESLGIEVHCPGYANGLEDADRWDFDVFVPFNKSQKLTIKTLTMYLRDKFKIELFLAHSSIAPGRKTDPGPFFFWEDLKQLETVKLVDERKIIADASLRKKALGELFRKAKDVLTEIGFVISDDEDREGVYLLRYIDSYFLQFDPFYWRQKNESGCIFRDVDTREKIIRLLEGAKTIVG
ncbi:MAG: hypothetical protein CMM87_05810 [Rickettsiales bacterium]|nr:hypothetical protein [Rickettsiales bacterium]|tara:strand:+ start:16731 stop:17699 length:969 start_codon:yes stop_codon:yes gene_type:complete